MARPIDAATISFGLVSIPVKLYSTAQHAAEIHFHMVHRGCGERIRYELTCPRHGKVERADTVKGFELSKGNFVELEKDELAALEAATTDAIAIREFVPAAAIDPVFYDRSYYLAPDRGGHRAYRLLRDALDRVELVAVGTFAARGHENIVSVHPYETGLVLHQLRYADEVRPWAELELGTLPHPTAAELDLAEKVVDQLRHDAFDAAAYKDDVKDRVRALVAEKAKGGEIVAPPEAPHPPVTDLMAALKASLEKPAPKPHGKRAHASPRRSRSRPHHGRAAPTRRSRTHAS
jgi:DNA end-binding protein Ku